MDAPTDVPASLVFICYLAPGAGSPHTMVHWTQLDRSVPTLQVAYLTTFLLRFVNNVIGGA